MTGIFNMMLDYYKQIVGESRQSPLMNSLPLMSSPYPVLCILAAYLLFVLALGPWIMKNRKPLDLKTVITGYNAYQVIFSLWLATMLLRHWDLVFFGDKGCAPIDIAALPAAVIRGAWWYFISKIIELLDTTFFVLRKKQDQVTFLHLYHHTVMVFISWLIIKYFFVEHGIVGIVANSLVHVMMYTYYFLAAMGPAVRRHLWWKKYLTKIQLLQFLVLLGYLVSLVVYDCKLPQAVLLINIANLSILFCLFGLFYRRAYHKDQPSNSTLLTEEQEHIAPAGVSRLYKLGNVCMPTQFGLYQGKVPSNVVIDKRCFKTE